MHNSPRLLRLPLLGAAALVSWVLISCSSPPPPPPTVTPSSEDPCPRAPRPYSCTIYSKPEARGFSQIFPIYSQHATLTPEQKAKFPNYPHDIGTYGALYACAALPDSLLRDVLGTPNFHRSVANGFICHIYGDENDASGNKFRGELSVYIGDGLSWNDWVSSHGFSLEKHEITVGGRRAVVHGEYPPSKDVHGAGVAVDYTVEIPSSVTKGKDSHSYVWVVELRRDSFLDTSTYRYHYIHPDPVANDDMARRVIDALAEYDHT